MADHARILREIAVEYDGSAKAKEHWVAMAEGGAARPNLPPGQAADYRKAADRARETIAHCRARAAAARAGADALEGRGA